MKALRLAVGLASALVLGGGYAAAQYAYFAGTVENYTEAVSQPAMSIVAWLLLVAVIALGAVEEKARS